MHVSTGDMVIFTGTLCVRLAQKNGYSHKHV